MSEPSRELVEAPREKLHRLVREQKGKCWWCSRDMHLGEITAHVPMQRDRATLDHVYPSSQRYMVAPRHREACVAACYRCNSRRGDMAYTDFVMMDGIRQRTLDRHTVAAIERRLDAHRDRLLAQIGNEGLRRFRRRFAEAQS